MATDSPKPMSPTAAVVRHLEWLEFALAAARDEEARRRGRLDKATDKNRDKRTVRLAEVSAEVLELAALVKGLKDLQAKGVAVTRKPRTTRSASGTIRRSPAASRPVAAASAAPQATVAAPRKAATAPKMAAPKKTATAPKKAAATKKRATSRSKPTTTRTRTSPTATAPTGPTV